MTKKPMKTVSTKLDNKLHNRFMEICNEDGGCQSEMLRDLIETLCEDLEDEAGIIYISESEPIPELKNPKVEIIYD